MQLIVSGEPSHYLKARLLGSPALGTAGVWMIGNATTEVTVEVETETTETAGVVITMVVTEGTVEIGTENATEKGIAGTATMMGEGEETLTAEVATMAGAMVTEIEIGTDMVHHGVGKTEGILITSG